MICDKSTGKDYEENELQKEKMSKEFTKHLLNFPNHTGGAFHLVVHNFTGPDKGGPHDHPFRFTTSILKGGYIERIYHILPDGHYKTEEVFRPPGTTHIVEATCIHEIIDLPNGECWTVIIPEVKIRESGFWRFQEEGIFFKAWNRRKWIAQKA